MDVVVKKIDDEFAVIVTKDNGDVKTFAGIQEQSAADMIKTGVEKGRINVD